METLEGKSDGQTEIQPLGQMYYIYINVPFLDATVLFHDRDKPILSLKKMNDEDNERISSVDCYAFLMFCACMNLHNVEPCG